MMQRHWAHQEPPAADDFFTPGVAWGSQYRFATTPALVGSVPPTSPTNVSRVQKDPSQTIAKWLHKDHELAQAKLREWVEKKQRELLSSSHGGRHPPQEQGTLGSADTSSKRQLRQSVPTTPKKQTRPAPLLSPPHSVHRQDGPSATPKTPSKPPTASPATRPPKTPHNPAEAQAAYNEWLKRKSAKLDLAVAERTRREAEKSAHRAAANALAKQRYEEWKATRKAPQPPVRPRLHQFPISSSSATPAGQTVQLQHESHVTFADMLGDVAFNTNHMIPRESIAASSSLPSLGRSTTQHRLAFGRPILGTTSTSNCALHKQALPTNAATKDSNMDPPNLVSPPAMFAELERMQKHYPAYLKRFPGHVAHAGASVGKVWIDPTESIQAQAASAAKWARLNSAVGCYCSSAHDERHGSGRGRGCGKGGRHHQHEQALEEVGFADEKKQSEF